MKGVDVDLGNLCSRIAYTHAEATFPHRQGLVGEVVPGLRASFSQILRFGSLLLGITSDGIGTKVEVAERMNRYDTLGFDLVAMVVDDLVANGVRPVAVSNVLDADRLDPRVVDELMAGLERACREAGVLVSGGEIAELGSRVSGWGDGMHFNWCATAVGYLPPGQQPIDGSAIRPSDEVVALRSRGFRSNGFSALRSILADALGPQWHLALWQGQTTWGEVLLTPSRIFAPGVVRLLEAGLPVGGVAHITGGGIPDNLARPLRTNGLGARLESLFAPWPFMVEAQRLGQVPEGEAYRMWNMGNGMLLVVRRGAGAEVVSCLQEAGYEAQVAGFVTEEPTIVLHSGGAHPQILGWPL